MSADGAPTNGLPTPVARGAGRPRRAEGVKQELNELVQDLRSVERFAEAAGRLGALMESALDRYTCNLFYFCILIAQGNIGKAQFDQASVYRVLDDAVRHSDRFSADHRAALVKWRQEAYVAMRAALGAPHIAPPPGAGVGGRRGSMQHARRPGEGRPPLPRPATIPQPSSPQPLYRHGDIFMTSPQSSFAARGTATTTTTTDESGNVRKRKQPAGLIVPAITACSMSTPTTLTMSMGMAQTEDDLSRFPVVPNDLTFKLSLAEIEHQLASAVNKQHPLSSAVLDAMEHLEAA